MGAIFELYFAARAAALGAAGAHAVHARWAQRLADFLPFQWTFSFPIEALIGDSPPPIGCCGLAMQALWVGVGTVLMADDLARRRETILGGGELTGVVTGGALGLAVSPRLRDERAAISRQLLRADLCKQASPWSPDWSAYGWCSTRPPPWAAGRPAELLAVMGVYTIMGGVISALIQPNMEKLMDDIQRGNLDFLLTKPEDPQLLISIRDGGDLGAW